MSQPRRPLAARFLSACAGPEWADSIEGDLQEHYGRLGLEREAWSWGTVLPIAARLGSDRLTRAARSLGARMVVAASPRGNGMIQGLGRDVRFSLRTMRRAPIFTVAAAATLSLGIGSSTVLYSFVDAFIFRAASYAFAVIAAIFGYGWRVLAMFLVGAALMKLDFFSPERRAWQRRMCAIGLGIGLPLELGVAATFMAVDFQYTWQIIVAGAVHELASFALCLGYTGAVCLLVRPGAGGLVQRLFSSAGRLALSVYLLETITTTAVMYWWGLGRFDDFTRPELLVLTVGIYTGLMVAATVWLRFFTIGPFEWLWRTLTYLRPQPVLRRSARSS